jgi:nucleoside-diphosphate-sugar epimerase
VSNPLTTSSPIGEPSSGPLLLTGAGGWFGTTALHVFEQIHGPEALRQRVVPFASHCRSIEFGSPHGPVEARDLRGLLDVPNPSGLLHLAFLTRDRAAEVGQAAYVAANRAITAHVAALLRANPILPVITTSSGAAAALDGAEPDLEGNPYATLKQAEEALVRQEAGTRMAVVFRVYAASGRFIRDAERFALGDFLLQAMAKKRLIIQSPCPVERSYVYVSTMMELAWSMLIAPDPPGFQIMDACTDQLSLLELATLISRREGLPIPRDRINPGLTTSRYCGDGKAFRAKLKERDITPLTLDEQIRDTREGLAKSYQRAASSYQTKSCGPATGLGKDAKICRN